MKIYGIYDEKLEDFCEVFHMPNNMTAIRAFEEQCKRENTPLNKHPEDYELRFIMDTCLPYDAKENMMKVLIEAKECINEKNS